MKRLLCAVLLSLLAAGAARAQVAVIPYMVENPSSYFAPSNGAEYAKLLALALAIAKEVDVASPRDTALDLQRNAIDPQGVLTGEGLQALAKGGYVDFFLLGKMKKTATGYASDSVLYSVRERRVVSSCASRAKTLVGLAERDVKGVFTQFRDRAAGAPRASRVDAVIVLDTSYAVLREWRSLIEGVQSFVGAISDNWNLDTRLSVLPFSKHCPRVNRALNIATPTGLSKALGALAPKGADGEACLAEALSFAARSISWREGSTRAMLLVTNTPIRNKGFLERHLIAAKRKGVRTVTLSLGRLSASETAAVKQLAIVGGGRHVNATYHQRLYDIDGRPLDIFLEAGRLFQSRGFEDWRQGLFAKRAGSNTGYAKPDAGLEEFFYSEKKRSVDPYSMAEHFGRLSKTPTVRAETVENNIESALVRAGGALPVKRGSRRAARQLGKALISDGAVSLWVRITTEKDLAFFREKSSSRFFFPLGVSLQKKADEPYGFAINSERMVTNITADFVPDVVSAKLGDMVKNPAAFMGKGLFRPPVWFITVKVEEFEGETRGTDIRDR